jgi:hypothetical protein
MNSRDPRATPLREPDELNDISIVPGRVFAGVLEPGVEALLGSDEENLVPVGGDIMIYGDGGVGKTTLAVDLAFHLAAGSEWIGIPFPRPARVLLIENEGPRPLFRRKLRRKYDAWASEDERLYVWEHPWSAFTFGDREYQAQLARLIYELEIDLVIAGPVTQLGMDEAGTIQEVRRFAHLVAEVRERSLRPIAFLLVHHESKTGRVSGAWEGVGDTLIHVQGSGNGRTRVFVQKARWASEYHARTIHLRWADAGDTYIVDESVDDRPERTWDAIEAFVLDHPGCSWKGILAAVKGQKSYLAERRDAMLSEGLILNAGHANHYELWHRDDPARPHSLDENGARVNFPEAFPEGVSELARRAREDAER